MVLLFGLLAFSCGGGDGLLTPTQVTGPATVHGLVRERADGDFLEFATETFEALYEAETARAPEWAVSGGDLAVSGQTVRWQLPRAGRHVIGLKLFLADGREVDAVWTVDVRPREGAPAR